jgi:hypothetical protein
VLAELFDQQLDPVQVGGDELGIGLRGELELVAGLVDAALVPEDLAAPVVRLGAVGLRAQRLVEPRQRVVGATAVGGFHRPIQAIPVTVLVVHRLGVPAAAVGRKNRAELSRTRGPLGVSGSVGATSQPLGIVDEKQCHPGLFGRTERSQERRAKHRFGSRFRRGRLDTRARPRCLVRLAKEALVILQGKTVIVSGVGPGLGGEVARIALRDGANVVIGARNAAKLDSIAKELDPSGKRVAAHAFDITDYAACEGLVAFAEQRFGGADALVQVAAFDAVFGTVATTKAEDWRRVMEVNVIGTTQLCRAMVPALEKRGGQVVPFQFEARGLRTWASSGFRVPWPIGCPL